MFTVTDQQAGQRWDILTPPLREALFSDVSGDFVWKLCEDEHLTKEKIYRVGELAGYVLYGFIHPEDLSAELVKSLELPAPLAKEISDRINARIFAPLKADIDRVYSPLIQGGDVPVETGPKVMQNTTAAVSTIPKPTILSDVGWSKTSPSAPIAPRVPAPTPVVPATAPAKPAEPAPVILHEDTSFKAVEKNAGFTLSRPAGGAEVHMGGPSTVPIPPRSAVLEFGGAVKPPVPAGPSSSPDIRAPLSAMPTASAGPRSVSQIVPLSPSPAVAPPPRVPAQLTPPTPPAPPSPPKPPQGDQPIVKDFL